MPPIADPPAPGGSLPPWVGKCDSLCRTRMHCFHHQRCLAECMPEDLAPPAPSAPEALAELLKPGTWPQVCVQRAFVEGAQWWEFQKTQWTMWPSDRDFASDEAVRRYGPPRSSSQAQDSEQEQDSARRPSVVSDEQATAGTNEAAPAPWKRAHELKVWPVFFDALLSGIKPFEIRKNDRDFWAGDLLVLNEFEPEGRGYTGRGLTRTVSYVTDYEQQAGFVVLGLSPAASKAPEVGSDSLMNEVENKDNKLRELPPPPSSAPSPQETSRAPQRDEP
jgi:hypothetical protein